MNTFKKIIFSLGLIVILFACSKTPEEKANVLIKEHMEKSLYHPDTYDPTETVIDSAFYPVDDPELHQKLFEAYKLNNKMVDLDDKIKFAKSQMALFSNHYTEYIRNEYNEAKQEYESLLAEQEKLQSKAEKMNSEFVSMAETIKKEGRKFIGFKARHTFRCSIYIIFTYSTLSI